MLQLAWEKQRSDRQTHTETRVYERNRPRAQVFLEARTQSSRCNSVIHYVGKRSNHCRVSTRSKHTWRAASLERLFLEMLISTCPGHGHRMVNRIAGCGVTPIQLLSISFRLTPQPLARAINWTRGRIFFPRATTTERDRRDNARR